jgi:hypothetical protein
MGILVAIGAAIAGTALAAAATFGVVQTSNSTPGNNPATNSSEIVNYGQ